MTAEVCIIGSLMEFFRLLPTPFNFVVIIVSIVVSASLLTSVVKQVRKVVCHRQELQFKREMIDRGMTIDEVERLVNAGSKNYEWDA